MPSSIFLNFLLFFPSLALPKACSSIKTLNILNLNIQNACLTCVCQYDIKSLKYKSPTSLVYQIRWFLFKTQIWSICAENPSVASHFFQGKAQTPSQDLTSYIFWPCLPPQLISPWACFPSFHQPVSVFDSSLCLLLLLGLLGMLLPLPEMFFPPSLAH